ncbi:MAG TPA: VCBS repeat-containing protein, partial [Pyrinomonadaceae bacterium]
MSFKKILKIVLVFTFLFIASQEIRAQYAYGLSDIVYDNTTGKVTSLSRTSLDYWAGLHYDPAVVGGVFQEGQLLGYSSHTGYANVFSALVSLRTVNSAPPDTRYDVLSDHYIVAYFYTTVIIWDDETPVPVRRYYDPFGFGSFGGGSEPGWSSFKGSAARESFWEYQYFYLGTTGKGIIANPTVCHLPLAENNAAPCPTPTPITVQITNRFKPNQDLSASSEVQQALVGASVDLRAVVSPESSQTTYRWTSASSLGDQCNTNSLCSVKFNQPTQDNQYHTINLEVRQGSQPPVTKSVRIKVSMPTITYTGTERMPRVTTSSNPCVVGILTNAQNLILGCPDTIPATRNSIDDYGLYAKAVVTPPTGFISDGTTSYVEFRQLVKPARKSFGRNVSECLVFDTAGQDGWREDFNGRDPELFPEFLAAGFKLRSTFRNNATGTNADAILEFLDSPGTVLANTNANNVNLNKYTIDDQFETYVTYFAGLEDSENLGDEYRHALAVMPWKWSGAAEKRSSGWQLVGAKFPQTEPTPVGSELKTFSLTSTGERAFSGTFRNDNERYESCSSKPPVNIRTKRNIAVWRNGIWYVMNEHGGTQTVIQWGVDYDIPVPGDYDGDGISDFAVYRPDNPATPEDECQFGGGCAWYIIKSAGGSLYGYQLGAKDDKPVPADYDGDGKTDMAVFRPSNAGWYQVRSSDNTFYGIQFGQFNDVFVSSDFDGDGIDDLSVWSPTNAAWTILNSSNQAVTSQQWGFSTDKPVIGDYDGDGKTDIANWQADGLWHILLSSN